MSKMNEKDLRRRDAKRNIGEELLHAVLEMKAGKAARMHRIPVSAITEARARSGLSQARLRSFWACPRGYSRNGNRDVGSRQVRREPF
jgi:hypothetical protein